MSGEMRSVSAQVSRACCDEHLTSPGLLTGSCMASYHRTSCFISLVSWLDESQQICGPVQDFSEGLTEDEGIASMDAPGPRLLDGYDTDPGGADTERRTRRRALLRRSIGRRSGALLSFSGTLAVHCLVTREVLAVHPAIRMELSPQMEQAALTCLSLGSLDGRPARWSAKRASLLSLLRSECCCHCTHSPEQSSTSKESENGQSRF